MSGMELVEKSLGVKFLPTSVHHWPGDQDELKEKWYHMCSLSGESFSYTQLCKQLAQTTQTRANLLGNKFITLYACYRCDKTPMLLWSYLSMCSKEMYEYKSSSFGDLRRISHKTNSCLVRSDNIIMSLDEVKSINTGFKRAIEYSNANIRKVSKILAQANNEGSQSPLKRIPVNLQALIVSFSGYGVVHDEVDMARISLPLLS